MQHPDLWRRSLASVLYAASLLTLMPSPRLTAQESAVIRGLVVRRDDGSPLKGVVITVADAGFQAASDQRGHYVLPRLSAGPHLILFREIGYQPARVEILLAPGETRTLDAALEPNPVLLGEIEVTSPTRTPERALTAPASISIVESSAARDVSITGQAPLALAGLPGVDVVQNGMNDFNVNTRGFNGALNRRVLVLLDGRDLATSFTGSQEWSALSLPLEDISQIEMVRGPGSALYGPNAFNAVLDIRTPSARDVVGTKLTLAGGELGTLQGDLRHAGLFRAGRFGYRVNVGYRRNDTWSRSRTNIGDLAREYSEAIDTTQSQPMAPFPGFELQPLRGQTKSGPPGLPGVATGDRDALVTLYGTARLEFYATSGAVLTAEGGDARTDNETYLTGAGRGQGFRSLRPWARVAWDARNLHAMAWYSGRSQPTAIALGSGTRVSELSRDFHGELRYDRAILNQRGQIVLGGSLRSTFVDSDTTLFPLADDARTDWYYSAYSQLEYQVLSRLRLIGAARLDDGDLFSTQLSPKAAAVYSPNEWHAIHLSFSRAFQTPTTTTFFLGLPAGPPADFSALEAGLRASPLGPALAGVPEGGLFTRSSAVPLLVLGNRNLDVERILSWEVGYKGQFARRVFVTLDAYYNRLANFVTEPLPGVNPAYGPWTAPAEVSASARTAVEGAVRDQLAAAGQPIAATGLTRLADGRTAIVLSFGNAGRATTKGIEFGTGVRVGEHIRFDANYSVFGFAIKTSSLVPGSIVLPNTAKHRVNLSVAYTGRHGLDARVSARLVSGYIWASGIFTGTVPSSQTIDGSFGYQMSSSLYLHLVGTDLLDQRRYQVFGGSVIGRRVLGGLTLTL
jgi:outer membrane receptor for ferrienterochelin and colicins